MPTPTIAQTYYDSYNTFVSSYNCVPEQDCKIIPLIINVNIWTIVFYVANIVNLLKITTTTMFVA